MTRDGRPLRFLAVVLTGWVGARAMILWPAGPAAVARETILASAAATPQTRAAVPSAPPPVRIVVAADARSRFAQFRRTPAMIVRAPLAPFPARAPIDLAPDRDRFVPGMVAGLPHPPLLRKQATRSRLFGSAWAVARGGSGPPGGVPGVQLGGSQAGVRLGYALTADRRLALVARASSPLGRGMRDLALGFEWQPTRLPVRVIAEQRFALGAGAGGPTLAAVGGIGPLPLAAGFRLEAYAQGGVIARDGAEGFADGALRIAHPLATLGRVRIDLGGGTWGAAQRGASRVDVGPSLSAVVPIGPQPVRLSLDWRQRVAGNAAPGSGPVVTLGADF